MRYWDIDDWMIFAVFVAVIAIGIGIFLPLFIVMVKESWAWMLSR